MTDFAHDPASVLRSIPQRARRVFVKEAKFAVLFYPAIGIAGVFAAIIANSISPGFVKVSGAEYAGAVNSTAQMGILSVFAGFVCGVIISIAADRFLSNRRLIAMDTLMVDRALSMNLIGEEMAELQNLIDKMDKHSTARRAAEIQIRLTMGNLIIESEIKKLQDDYSATHPINDRRDDNSMQAAT